MAGIIVLLFSYILSQFYRAFLAVLSPVLSAEVGASATDLSNAAAAWFIVFALMQFPVGVWLDKNGPRKTAGILFLVCSAGGIALFAIASSPNMLIVAMALIGAGCSPVLMATFYLFARNYAPARFATLGAVFVGLGSLGNVAGTQPLAYAIELVGWRNVALGLAMFTAVVGLGILLLVKDPLKQDKQELKAKTLDLFKIPELWLIFPIVFIGYGIVASLRGLWAGPYLGDVYGASTNDIGSVTFFMAIALVVGSLVYGPMDRIFNSRKWVVMVGGIGMLIPLIVFLAVENLTLGVVTILLVAIGLFGASYPVQVAHGMAFVPAHLTGRGVTLLNFFAIGGVGVIQALSGFVVEASTLEGVPTSGYHALFLFFSAILSVVILIYLFSKDARPS